MNKNPSPLTKVEKTFRKPHPVFMPYFPLGYPDYETSLQIIHACVDAGAEMMELGIPFSDPLADGPTIQESTQIALKNGMTTQRCLVAIAELRKGGIDIPFMLMGYINPILAFGMDDFVFTAKEAGANGIIIPDLPPEEAVGIETLCREQGLALSFLLAPNSPEERIKLIAERSSGFIYLVSVTGVTGIRDSVPSHLGNFVTSVRDHSTLPLAVGFGISTPQQAKAVGKLADGVIVGSALIHTVSQSNQPTKAASKFVQEMVNALQA